KPSVFARVQQKASPKKDDALLHSSSCQAWFFLTRTTGGTEHSWESSRSNLGGQHGEQKLCAPSYVELPMEHIVDLRNPRLAGGLARSSCGFRLAPSPARC